MSRREGLGYTNYVDNEVETLKVALKWALDYGVKFRSWEDEISFSAYGCGCCSEEIKPPAEIADVVLKCAAEMKEDDAT